MRNLFDPHRISARDAARLTGVTAEGVRARVAAQLGDADARKERSRILMKKKFLVTAAVAAALCATTAIAANANDLMHYFFTGDTSPVSEAVQTVDQNVTVGDYRVTVEQALFAENRAYVLYSVEALTDEAFVPMQENFGLFLFDHIGVSFDGVSSHGLSVGGWNVPERNTGRRMYEAIEIVLENPTGADLLIHVRSGEEEGYLRIPAACNVETRTIQVNREIEVTQCPEMEETVRTAEELLTPCMIESVAVDPMGVQINYHMQGDDWKPAGFLFFRMQDGSIRTFSELCEFDSAVVGKDVYTFREIMDLSRIDALLIDGMAYPMDGGAPEACAMPDDVPAPFLLEPVILEGEEDIRPPMNTPVRALCEKLGAALEWDAATQIARITYRERTIELAVGVHEVSLPGSREPVTVAVSIENGTLTASRVDELLGIRYERFGMTDTDYGSWLVIP